MGEDTGERCQLVGPDVDASLLLPPYCGEGGEVRGVKARRALVGFHLLSGRVQLPLPERMRPR